MITSSIDGRLRARAPGLEHTRRADRVKQNISRYPGIEAVSVNTLTGSLLVIYDCRQTPRSEIEAFIEAQLVSERRKGKRQGAFRRKSVRTIVNYALLISFGASMAGLLLGGKKAHIYFGNAFVAALGAHLLQNKSELLRPIQRGKANQRALVSANPPEQGKVPENHATPALRP